MYSLPPLFRKKALYGRASIKKASSDVASGSPVEPSGGRISDRGASARDTSGVRGRGAGGGSSGQAPLVNSSHEEVGPETRGDGSTEIGRRDPIRHRLAV